VGVKNLNVVCKKKDTKIRASFAKIEKLNKLNKFLFINLLNNPSLVDKKANLLFTLMKLKIQQLSYSKVQIVNRCVLTNRNKGSIRPLGISRVALRDLMHFGIVPGFKKAVW